MKKQRFFIFEADKCIGCNGCSAACINTNQNVGTAMEYLYSNEENNASELNRKTANTPAAEPWRQVYKVTPEDGKNNTLYLSMSCNHCENPPCLNACPTNSYTKREEDGVVIHNQETCMGCKYCIMACPYGAIKYNSATMVVEKCHFCFERLSANEEPACIKSCFGGALSQILTDSEEIINKFDKEIIGVKHIPPVNASIRFTTKNTEKQGKKFPPAIPDIKGENNG